MYQTCCQVSVTVVRLFTRTVLFRGRGAAAHLYMYTLQSKDIIHMMICSLRVSLVMIVLYFHIGRSEEDGKVRKVFRDWLHDFVARQKQLVNLSHIMVITIVHGLSSLPRIASCDS